MKFGLCMVLFALFFSAVGFTARSLWDSTQPVLPSKPVARGDAGPYLHTVDRLADELELTAEQRIALGQLIDRTAQEMAQCEQQQRAIVLESRRAVTRLLTAEQNQKLERTVDEFWTKYRERRIAAVRELCATEFGLCAMETARIASAFRAYEEQKGEWYRASRLQDEMPDHQQREQIQRQLKEEFERRMEGVLTVAQQERLWRQADAVGHRDCDEDRGGERAKQRPCEVPVIDGCETSPAASPKS